MGSPHLDSPCACVLSHLSFVFVFRPLWNLMDRLLCLWGFSRQEYWSGLLCSPPGDFPEPGIKPKSLTSPALEDRFFTTSATWEALVSSNWSSNKNGYSKVFLNKIMYSFKISSICVNWSMFKSVTLNI